MLDTRIVFEEKVDSEEYGTTTLYFLAPKDAFEDGLKEKIDSEYPEAEHMTISVEFPTATPEACFAKAMLSPTKDGEDYDWFDVDLCYADISELIDRGIKGRRVTLGSVVVTCGVDEMMKSDFVFEEWVKICLGKYINCDWGDTCDEDRQSNDDALKNGERILAVYIQPKTGTKIWIITEWDRSVTTILFPSEY